MVDKSKKTLFVWEKLSIGGAEVALINLVELIRKRGLSVDLYLLYDVNEFNRFPFDKIYFARRFYKPNKVRRLFTLLIALYKLAKIINLYDTVVINDVPLLNILGVMIRCFFKGKIIYWSHLGKKYFQQVAKKSVVWTNYFVLKNIADFVVCVSDYAKRETVCFLKSYGNDNKVKVIYNIVKTKPCNIVDDSCVDNIWSIICVSRLYKEKGVHELIKAFNEVILAGVENVELTICGTGEEYLNLKLLVNQLNLTDKVFFLGQVLDPLQYIVRSDILVSSSYTETFSMVVAEALMCKRFIVTTNTAAAELVGYGKYGLVVEVGSHLQIAEAILRLIRDKKLRSNFIKNNEEALERFSYDKILANWIEIL